MKENKINTGLWTKKSNKGTTYASGKIKIEDKEYKIVLFKVGEKKNEIQFQMPFDPFDHDVFPRQQLR